MQQLMHFLEVFKKCNKWSDFKILYGFHSTPFGECFIGITKLNSICHLSFVDHEQSLKVKTLQSKWPRAELKENLRDTEDIVKSIFSESQDFHLIVQGTDFQIKVWQALISIAKGSTTSYENIAYVIDKPKAVRAAANAIANNPIAYLIPCHRVICKSGKINKYRWGILRKKAILDFESS